MHLSPQLGLCRGEQGAASGHPKFPVTQILSGWDHSGTVLVPPGSSCSHPSVHPHWPGLSSWAFGLGL